MDERLKILNNIIDITTVSIDTKDTTGITPVEIKSIRLEFSSNKYSSKKNSIYHITLNDKHLSKKDAFNIKYKCVSCDAIHIVGTTQFLRKINKCSYRCGLCVNKDEIKRLNHSCYLSTLDNKDTRSIKQQTPSSKPSLSLREQKAESDRIFEEYDDDFKDNYYTYHLTNEDYERISKNIISLQNGKYKIEDLEYWSVFKTNNQMLFSSVFYDNANNLVIKANQPIMRCDNCGNDWRAKTLEKYKNCHKILCPACAACALCNRTYKIRTTKNCVKDIILYQSKLELNFINWCNNNSIIVRNGPVLPYVFLDVARKYKVDFVIKCGAAKASGDGDILIEIKDNHIWYRNDIKSGKHEAKLSAVRAAIEKGDYKEYYLITPDIWVNTLKTIKARQASKPSSLRAEQI